MKESPEKVTNVPVVVSDKGDLSRIVGAADINYETGEIQLYVGADTLAVLQGTYGEELAILGLFFRGKNTSEQPAALRHEAWTNMLSRKEIFEYPTTEKN